MLTKTTALKALLVILLLASALRIWGINYGLPQLYHPDEPNKIEMAQRMFKTGDLNPHYFKKPTLFIYLNAALYIPYYAAGRVLDVFSNPMDIPMPVVICGGVGHTTMSSTVLMGRLMTVAWSLLSILFTYLVGKTLSGRRSIGLLSALLLTISPTHTYHARFITVNAYLTAAVIAAAWFSLRILKSGRSLDYILAGVFSGLAISFKYPGVWIALMIPMAHFLRADSRGFRDSRFYLGLIAIPITFLIGNPYALLDYRKFVEDVLYEYTHYSSGNLGMEGEPLRWYINYALTREGLITVLAVVMMVYGGVHSRKSVLLFSSFPLVYFAFIASFTVRNGRTFLPLVPFLCVLASLAYGELLRIGKSANPRFQRALLVLLLVASAFGLAESLRRVFQSGHSLTQVDGRATASVWVEEHIPPGSRVVVESYSTFLSPEKYDVYGVGMIPENTLEWYREAEFDYFIFGEGMFGRFYQDPDRYPQYIAQYEELFSELDLVRRIDDGGYEIKVYRFPPS